MTHRERILRHLAGEPVDRLPMIGGWIQGVRSLAAIGEISVEQYLADPWAGVLQANRRLQVDGILSGSAVPTSLESIRGSHLQEESFSGVEPEELLQRAEQIPDSEAAVLAHFDAAAVEAEYRKQFTEKQQSLGEIALIPTLWEAPANFSLYFQYGYVAFLTAAALYPEAVERIWWEDGVISRARNAIVARLIRELDIIPMLLTGDDICNNSGPLASPDMLRKHLWPHVKNSLEPFTEAGIRIIHHCDGNVAPLVDDMVAAGYSGFQGFQYECGIDIASLRRRRSVHGDPLIILGGLSVTRTLPFGTEADVRREVDYCLDATDGGKGFFLFTSNVTGVEVPPANIIAAYVYLRTYDPNNPRPAIQSPPALEIDPRG